jgi:hypothetical protein
MTYKETFRMNQRDFDEELEDNITEAAQCLLGISADWGYFEIEQFLDWQLDNLDELPEGYPEKVMTREYESLILEEVERLLN